VAEGLLGERVSPPLGGKIGRPIERFPNRIARRILEHLCTSADSASAWRKRKGALFAVSNNELNFGYFKT
jgi:hypothetical protein